MSFSQKAQGFHSEIEDFLLELNRMESQLSASKPTGGLPETAREQLDTHMVIAALQIAHKRLCSVASLRDASAAHLQTLVPDTGSSSERKSQLERHR